VKRFLHWFDYLTINIYWFGLTSISQTMTPLVVPLLVQQFVGEELKGTYYGNLRLWQLMTALLVQALMGMISDHSSLPWGRRRPFIVIGTLGDILIIFLIGLSVGVQGLNGYWFLFSMILLLMFFSNIAHAAQQGLIPDLVPLDKRGRYSSIKAIFEIPLPVILVGLTIGRMVKNGNIWGGLFTLIAILIVAAGITMFVREERHPKSIQPLNWQPFLRLLLMTATFTAIILASGQIVRWVSQASANLSNLSYLLITSTAGFAGMAVAIFLGVYLSIYLGLGTEQAKNRSFTWWVINRLAFLVGATNLISFTLYFLQSRLGYRQEEAAGPAANLTIFLGAFIFLAAIPSGWLSDRFGRKVIVAISGVLAATGTAIITLIPNLTIIYIGACIIGSAAGLFYTANWALGTEIVPKEQAGRFLGMSNLAGAGAGAVGAYIGGPLADSITAHIAAPAGIGYIVLFAIYGLLFFLSTFALLGVRLHKST
jgi:MFS family permease